MRDLLPEIVMSSLQDRYLAGVANAEAAFDEHRADEDSVTGALGQALAMREPINFDINGSRYSAMVTYRKIRGRGRNAPEKLYGSDGIFQISVTNQAQDVVRQKGLPFQSKIEWRGKDLRLLEQAEKMEVQTRSGIVISFSPTGYSACTAKAAVRANGNRRTIEEYGIIEPLGQLLSKRFLECTIGTPNLFFDPQRESYISYKENYFDRLLEPLHVITTAVTVLDQG